MTESSYGVDVLRPQLADRAYLLVQAVVPDVTLAEWRRVVTSIFTQEKIITVTNSAGTVQGLCIYRIREHDITGRFLDVPFLIATSATDQEGIARTLLDYVTTRARSEHCQAVRIWTLGSDNWQRMHDPEFFTCWDHGLIIRLTPQSTSS
jgi:hypothetical protein